MTPVLLDTSVFLWFVCDDKRLDESTAKVIEDRHNKILLSVVSLWEIAIKQQLGKLELTGSFGDLLDLLLDGFAVEIVPIELAHLVCYSELPLHHRDPFDRLIIAQAKALDCHLLSSDNAVNAYDVKLVS